MSRTRLSRLVRTAALVLAVIVLAVWWRVDHRGNKGTTATPAASSTAPSPATAPSTSASGSSSASNRTPSAAASRSASAAAALGCETAASPITPTKFSVARLGVNATVVSVDEQSSGGTMAPPKNQPWQVAWIDTSARPGSSSPGAVNLTAHTYHAGGALGNLLYQTNPLKTGDIIKLSDGSGHAVCYRYTKQVKLWAKDYTAHSTVFYDSSSPPELRLMVCWDYNWSAQEWDSRVVFYAEPLTA